MRLTIIAMILRHGQELLTVAGQSIFRVRAESDCSPELLSLVATRERKCSSHPTCVPSVTTAISHFQRGYQGFPQM